MNISYYPIWFHIQIIFSGWFYLIVNLMQVIIKEARANFLIFHDEVLTGFKHSVKKQPPKVFYKNAVLKSLAILIEKTCVGVSF